MITKQINIIPDDSWQRIHVSQGDIGRTLQFVLYEGSTSYTIPTGATVKIQGTKPSGLGFSETCTWSGSTVTIDTTEAMTQEFGGIPTELQITDGTDVLGTSNFMLVVERNPHGDEVIDGNIDTFIPEMRLLVNQMGEYADEISTSYHSYGSPWVASTVAEMTDTDKIYVYVGSETGYTSGNWYYNNGTTWVSGGVYNAVAVQTDKTLSIEDMPADAKAVGDEVGELKSDLGDYVQKFIMSNQYLATFYCENNNGSFYFKLLKHPSATYSGVRIYGISGGTETGIQTSPIPLKEMYYNEISDSYDRIKITVGFGSQVSGEVQAIFSPNGGNNIASQVVSNTVSIKDMLRSVGKNLTGDLYADVPFITGKNIVADFTKCTVDTYTEILQSSASGSISSRAIKIRDDDGNLFANIYFIAPTTRANDIMCWTFDENGNPIGSITGAHLNDGFSSGVYYIVLVNYWGLKTVKALYDADKEYEFTVGASGKLYTSVTECLTRIAHVPYMKKVLIYSGTYDIYNEMGGDAFANAIASGTNWRTVSAVVGNNTKVIGVGRVTLQMTPTGINNIACMLLSPLNVSGDAEIENIEIVCSNCRYGIHIEDSTLAEYNDTKTVLKNVRVIRNHSTEGVAYNGPAIGVGMNARSALIFEDCYVDAKGGWAALYFHENTSTLELSPSLQIDNSIFKAQSGYGLALSASANQTTMINTMIAGSYVDTIRKMTGGSSAFDDAYKIVMLNCNMPTFSKSEYLENEVVVEHYNTIS